MFFSRWLPLVLLALAIYAHPVAAARPQGETLRKALSLLKAERPLEAETMLAGIDEGDSDYGAARTLLGFLLLQRAAAGEAERVFTQVLAADPQNAPARFGLGIALMRRGAPGRAALELEKAGTDPVVGHRAREIYSGITAAAPHNTEAWLGSIRSAKSSGDARGAYAACLSCLEHNPEDLQCREQAAFLALELRMYEESGHQLEFLLRNGHSSRDILNGLGFACMNRGDLEGAIRVFESSRDRYGTDSWIETNLGYVSRCRGDLIAAAGHYRRAAELDPSDPEKHYDLAFTLHLSGKYESAAQSLEAALRLRPGWGTAHYNLAMAYWNLRRHPLALAHARLAAQKGVARARAVVEILARNPAAAGRRP
ncbi:MAG: tetratricopeptide repeat protein [Acidobacteria bacterium]|nr:tetratricopeptide repeat protein [Acidobacteriota bacterium]